MFISSDDSRRDIVFGCKFVCMQGYKITVAFFFFLFLFLSETS